MYLIVTDSVPSLTSLHWRIVLTLLFDESPHHVPEPVFVTVFERELLVLSLPNPAVVERRKDGIKFFDMSLH